MTPEELKKYVQLLPKLAPYALKEDFEQKYNEMSVHTQRRKPEDLLIKRRPNEPDEVHTYRVDNYESVTYGSMNKAFDNIFRIMTPSNFHLTVENQELSDYLKTKNFLRNTFHVFFSKIYLKRMIDDPNGFIVWLPGGEGLEDSSKNVFAYPRLVFSFDLIDWEDDYIVFLSPDKSYIEYDDVVEKEGKIYWIFTKDSFYTYTQIKNNRFKLKEVYRHELGVLPIQILGGDLNSDGLYESFFAPYLAFGNEAVRQFSDWQSLSMVAAHPYREVFQMDCDVQELREEDPDESRKDNPDGVNLKYKHKRQRIRLVPSAYGQIDRPVGEKDPDGLGDSYLPPEIESMRWLRPPVEFVKAAQESYKLLLADAEDAMHLNLGGPDQSGVAKEMDLRLNDDFLNKIGNQVGDAIETSIKMMIAYYNASTFDEAEKGFKLTRPANFRARTSAELMKELIDLKTANAPAMLVAAIARQLAALRFSGDDLNQKIFEIVATYDPLFINSVAEKQSMTISTTSKKDDVTKSNYFYSILLNMATEMGAAAFVAATSESLYEKFLVKVAPYLVPATPLVDNNGLPA